MTNRYEELGIAVLDYLKSTNKRYSNLSLSQEFGETRTMMRGALDYLVKRQEVSVSIGTGKSLYFATPPKEEIAYSQKMRTNYTPGREWDDIKDRINDFRSIRSLF